MYTPENRCIGLKNILNIPKMKNQLVIYPQLPQRNIYNTHIAPKGHLLELRGCGNCDTC